MREPFALLKDSFSFFQINWKLFTGIFLVQGVLFVLMSLVTFFMGNSVGAQPTAQEAAIAGIFGILMIVVGILMSVALIVAIRNPMLSITEAYRGGMKFFWSYLLLSIMVGLVTVLGLILLIIPGIIVMVWFGFSHYILVAEGVKGIDAMKQSKALVKGRWFPVFFRMLVLVLLAIFASIITGFVDATHSDSLVMVIVADVVYLAVNAVLTSVSMIYLYFLYQDLKATPAEEMVVAPVPTTPSPEPTITA